MLCNHSYTSQYSNKLLSNCRWNITKRKKLCFLINFHVVAVSDRNCWMGSLIYLWLPLLCFLDEQKPAPGQQTAPGGGVLPKVPQFYLPVVKTTAMHKLFSKNVCCNLPHCPSELQKNTFLPQPWRSSMSSKLRSGSLWTRYPEATSSTLKPSGGVPRNSSSGVTVTLFRFTCSSIMVTRFFLLLCVLQSFLQSNARQMLLCTFYSSTSCDILQNKTSCPTWENKSAKVKHILANISCNETNTIFDCQFILFPVTILFNSRLLDMSYGCVWRSTRLGSSSEGVKGENKVKTV